MTPWESQKILQARKHPEILSTLPEHLHQMWRREEQKRTRRHAPARRDAVSPVAVAVQSEPSPKPKPSEHAFAGALAEAALDATVFPQPSRAKLPFTIFVAETDALLQNAMAQSLQTAGYNVVSSADLQQLLALVKKGDKPVDVLVTSVDHEADPAGALNLWYRFLRQTPQTSVLITSDSLATRKMAEAVDWTVLQKPFTGERLRTKVNDVLAAKTRETLRHRNGAPAAHAIASPGALA
jgi:CheY-like chemotaxis protein